jgi:regulator of protease activity HflC (stomatin/prohibitin superfamily)
VVVTGVISYEVADVAKLLLEVQGAQMALEDSACGVIGALVVRATWAQLLEPGFSNDVSIDVRRNAKKYGIHVVQVQFQDLTKSRSLRVWNSSTSTPSPQ